MKTFNALFAGAVICCGMSALCLLAASQQMRFVGVWDTFDTFMSIAYGYMMLVGVCLVFMVRELLALRG